MANHVNLCYFLIVSSTFPSLLIQLYLLSKRCLYVRLSCPSCLLTCSFMVSRLVPWNSSKYSLVLRDGFRINCLSWALWPVTQPLLIPQNLRQGIVKCGEGDETQFITEIYLFISVFNKGNKRLIQEVYKENVFASYIYIDKAQCRTPCLLGPVLKFDSVSFWLRDKREWRHYLLT